MVSSHTNAADAPMRIVFADLCYTNSFTAGSRYTPLNVGFIAQYVSQKAGPSVQVSIHKTLDSFCADVAAAKPEIVALSLYYWNTDLGRHAVRYVRSLYGKDVVVVFGGPSIDTDPGEQRRLFSVLPEADFLIPNEGELGFWNVVTAVASDRARLKHAPVDGAVFFADGDIRAGKPCGLNLDLSTLGSPYLSGLMDPFLTDEFQPLVQTSRFCPYTCAFCVSGKTRGKLRAFPIDQVKEEITYIARAYKGRDHQLFFIADENFGILSRDAEVAAFIRECTETVGYPRSVFFYNDKRFTDTSRAVVEQLADVNQLGLCLALQSENPETLKAINRRNVSEKEISDAIQWAKERGLATTTELIFGLPYESRRSFVDLLNRSVARGFDTVLCHNLFIMDGIELNRPKIREKYGIKTAFRLLESNYGYFGDDFMLEHEEVVIATDAFSEDDFFAVRGLNFMFYTVFALNFYKPFFQLMRNLGCGLADVFDLFLSGEGGTDPRYRKFLDDFRAAVQDELFPSRDALVAHVSAAYEANGRNVVAPSRINVAFGARLIYMEADWVKAALENVLRTHYRELETRHEGELNEVLELSERQRVNIRSLALPEPMAVRFDLLGWIRDKYQGLPRKLDAAGHITFSISDDARGKIVSFSRQFAHEPDSVFFYLAMDYIIPRQLLIYQCSYSDDVEAAAGGDRALADQLMQ